jgi:hypothetical protein
MRRLVAAERPTSPLGQTETNWHVRITSGSPQITDINLGQIARRASSANRPNGPHLTALARCKGRTPSPCDDREGRQGSNVGSRSWPRVRLEHLFPPLTRPPRRPACRGKTRSQMARACHHWRWFAQSYPLTERLATEHVAFAYEAIHATYPSY